MNNESNWKIVFSIVCMAMVLWIFSSMTSFEQRPGELIVDFIKNAASSNEIHQQMIIK